MTGWFELSENDKGQFYFVLKAVNSETILRSEQYQTRASAENGIRSVQENSATDSRYDRKESSDGRWYFNLRAGNNQIIGTSQMYKSTDSRETGITSVKENGPSALVKPDA